MGGECNDRELRLPFGGWAGKRSGRGHLGGRHIFEAMTKSGPSHSMSGGEHRDR
jgi:hypothetical protein